MQRSLRIQQDENENLQPTEEDEENLCIIDSEDDGLDAIIRHSPRIEEVKAH